MNVKSEAIKQIQSMADDCTWENVLYRIYVRVKIEQGIADCEAGRFSTQEEVEAEAKQWLSSSGGIAPKTTSVGS